MCREASEYVMAGKITRSHGKQNAGSAHTALEIIEGARRLRQKADFQGLRMLSYLLDLVALEAQDAFRDARHKDTGA